MPLSLMHRQYIPSARTVILFLLLLLATGVARAATYGVTTPGQQTLTNRFLPYAGSGTQLIGNSPAWRDSAGVLGINNYLEGLETLTPGAAVNLNFSTWRTKRITLNQNTIFTAINIPSASTNVQTMLLEVIGDGAFTVSFANVTWQTPEITTPEAGVVTLYALRGDSGAVKGYTQAVTATGIGPLTVGYVPLADATNNVTDSGLFQISTNRIGFSSTNQFFYTHEPDFTTAVGTDAYSSTATATTAFGFNALKLGLSNAHDDSAFGAFAGANLTSGAENSLFGRDAGLGITTENGNSYFGYAAGGGLTGGYNTIVGNGSGSAAGAVTNVIVLGQGIQPLVNNATYIGNTNTTAAYVIASGYTGTGANFLSDDGTYKGIGPLTSGYIPLANATNNVTDSIAYQNGTNNIVILGHGPADATNVVLLVNTTVNQPAGHLVRFSNNGVDQHLFFSDGEAIFGSSTLDGPAPDGSTSYLWDTSVTHSSNTNTHTEFLNTSSFLASINFDGSLSVGARTNYIVAAASGYTGAGTLFLSDDGTYKAAGGGGGNLLNTGTPILGNVPYYSDTTGTNAAPSGALILGASTNASVIGIVSADQAMFTNAIPLAGPLNMVRIGVGQDTAQSNESQVNIGYQAGHIATNAAYSINIGRHAGYQASGQNHVNVGHAAGQYATNDLNGVKVGYLAGQYATNSFSAVLVGDNAGQSAFSCQNGVLIGKTAGKVASSAVSSVIIGSTAAAAATGNIDISIMIGLLAGNNADGSSGSIFIGQQAGRYITADNRLAIDSNVLYSTNTGALIYGEFDNRVLALNGRVSTITGSTATQSKVGGTLKNDTTTTGNIGGGTDNLISYTIPADVLNVNGDSLEFDCGGTFAADAHLKTLTGVFGGTTFVNTTSLGFNNLSWRATGRIIRTGATTQKIGCTLTVGGTLLSAVNGSISTYNTAAETLSGTVVFKFTGSDDDGAPASNAVVQEYMNLKWTPNGN